MLDRSNSREGLIARWRDEALLRSEGRAKENPVRRWDDRASLKEIHFHPNAVKK